MIRAILLWMLCGALATAAELSIVGSWTGTVDYAAFTMEFRADNTVSYSVRESVRKPPEIVRGRYRVDYAAHPMTLDIADLQCNVPGADSNVVLWAIFEFRGANALRLCLEEGRAGDPVDRPSKFNTDTVELQRVVADAKPAPPVKAELPGLWLLAQQEEADLLFHFRSDGTMRQGTREKGKPISAIECRYKFDAAAQPMRIEWFDEDLPANDWKWGFEVRFVNENTVEFGSSADDSRLTLRRVPLTEWPETRPDLLPAFQKVCADAAAGNARAQGVLAGWWLSNEQRTGADYAKALEWARRSAEQNHPLGQYALARLLRDGLATNAAPEQAATLFEKCAAQMTKLAEAGDAVAAYRLGLMYGEGSGVAKDDGKSRDWLARAASKQHAPAQTTLGSLARADGKFDEALRWWRQAAEAGNALAQLNLAILYHNGQGVEKDAEAAANWARQAIAGNEPVAGVLLAKFPGSGEPVSPVEASRAIAKAERLLLLQANQGQPAAAFQLGQLYERDPDKAKKWYKFAADRGLPHAKAAYERLNQGAP
ncbi:MAG: hypothetical protein FJ395_02255 [Verrucomicrobia bacterium]|nr:hypothetical protein [Verrucomicrobiota bacterium]